MILNSVYKWPYLKWVCKQCEIYLLEFVHKGALRIMITIMRDQFFAKNYFSKSGLIRNSEPLYICRPSSSIGGGLNNDVVQKKRKKKSQRTI
jgi:hypothetical protein